MNKIPLFEGNRSSDPFDREPMPIDDNLTAYVLEDLPIQLRLCSEGELQYDKMSKSQNRLLVERSHSIFQNDDPTRAETVQLDLLFMLGGYLPLKGDAYKATPPLLLPMIDHNHARFGLPRRMDYEMIIDVNTKEYLRTGHIRVYSDGDDALDERDFYIGHSFAEAEMKSAYFMLRSIMEAPDLYDPAQVLDQVLSHIDQFKLTAQQYSNLSKEAFQYLRRYLEAYPEGVRNASGAFMPTVQLFELLLHKPDAEYSVFLDEAMPYFPSWSQDLLKSQRELSQIGFNLDDLVNVDGLFQDSHLKEKIQEIIGLLEDFRRHHAAITFKQVPEAFQDGPIRIKQLRQAGLRNIMEDGAARGTAGFNVPHILGNTILRSSRLKERFRS